MAKQRNPVRSLWLAIGLAGSLLAAPAFGQAYPTRPVKIIVPFATGGPADGYPLVQVAHGRGAGWALQAVPQRRHGLAGDGGGGPAVSKNARPATR